MADDQSKKDVKKEDAKPGDHGVQIDQSFVDWMVHRFMDSVLPWGVNKAAEIITGKITGINDRPKQLISFGEALTKLKEVDEHAYEVIKDFLLVGITTDADRNDFQLRTENMGGVNVDVTVAFLQLVAVEPDHKSRKDFLEAIGIIGERAIDPIERVHLIRKKFWNFLKTQGPQAWAWIRTDLDEGFTVLTAATEADNVRLQTELDRRREELATPIATPPPAGGNRFARAWNALRGQ